MPRPSTLGAEAAPVKQFSPVEATVSARQGTQRSASGGEGFSDAAGGVGAVGGVSGRGMLPVVKSYPHASQNRAFGGLPAEQFGQLVVSGASAGAGGVDTPCTR